MCTFSWHLVNRLSNSVIVGNFHVSFPIAFLSEMGPFLFVVCNMYCFPERCALLSATRIMHKVFFSPRCFVKRLRSALLNNMISIYISPSLCILIIFASNAIQLSFYVNSNCINITINYTTQPTIIPLISVHFCCTLYKICVNISQLNWLNSPWLVMTFVFQI